MKASVGSDYHVALGLVDRMRKELAGAPAKTKKIKETNGGIKSSEKVESDSTPPSEANNDAGSVSELPKK